MRDWKDYVFFTFMWAIVLVLVGCLVFGIMAWQNTTQGTVTDKYYSGPSVVCGKGCIPIDECYTIVVESEPWWSEDTCVSESRYHTIEIGDYFKE